MATAAPAALRSSQHTDTPALVLLSPFEEDHSSLGRFLVSTGFRVHRAYNQHEALAALRRDRVAVVIAESDLAEGGWKDVLSKLAPMPGAPLLIVASRNADNYLWAEVLNLGGYDVLSKPFYTREVARIVSLACERWASLFSGRGAFESGR